MKVELTLGEKTLPVMKIQRRYIYGDFISPLLIIIIIIPFSYTLSLIGSELISEEQKIWCKGTKETCELLYIDENILLESKRENLDMLWIIDKKAYDIVSQSWIINCLKMYNISDEVINFSGKTMITWRLKLTDQEKS